MVGGWAYAGGVLVGGVLAAAGVLPYAITGTWGGDFQSYWEMWRMVLAGRNPYEVGAYCGWLAEVGSAVICAGAPGVPPTGMLLAPVGMVPFRWALGVYTIAATVLGVVGLYAALVRGGLRSRAGYGVYGFAVLASYPAVASLAGGQHGHAVLAAWCWGYVGYRYGWVLVGLKPQVAGGMAWAWWLGASERAQVAAVSLGIVGALAGWPWWSPWASGLLATAWVDQGASVGRVLGRSGTVALAGVVLAAATWYGWRRRGRAWLVMPVAWAAVAPYGHMYDYVWLLGPLAAVTGQRGWQAVSAAGAFVIGAEGLAAAARSTAGHGGLNDAWSVVMVWAVLVVVLIQVRDPGAARAAEGSPTPQRIPRAAPHGARAASLPRVRAGGGGGSRP